MSAPESRQPSQPTRIWQLELSRSPSALSPAGRALPLQWRDAALLAWLAIEGPTPRARLAALLWPDSSTESARNSLRQRLFQLRKQIGFELVSGTTTLALAAGVAHDLTDGDGVLGSAPCEVDGEFAQWLELQRARRRARVRDSLVELAAMAERARDWPDALTHARELLALEPLSEDAHRCVMRLHYLAGDRAAALLAFDHCESVLKDEVGTTPSQETLALLSTIQASAPMGAFAVHSSMPASVQRPPRLVGRERDLQALAQAWSAGHVVALIGEAGMGKTRLLQAFVDGREGFVHVAGRPGDAGVPFATLARVLREVLNTNDAGASAAALPSTTRGAIARVLPEFDGGPVPRPYGEGQRLVLLRAVQTLLAAHAGIHTLLIDDLHFADAASIEMLGSLIDGIDTAGGGAPAPRRWMLAYRPAEAGSALHALHDRLVEQVRLAPWTLAPLGLAALAELVDSLALPGVSGSALAPGLLKRTGGNPLFVLETLKQAWVERTLAQLADAQTLPRPLSVGRLIERRVAQLSPRALAVARVAAIAGVDHGIALAEHVLQAPAMVLADAIGELEAAQVMRDDAFAHDLVAETVHASVPASVAVHTHAQVASWLEQHGGEPARIARHWIDGRQDLRALPWLGQAAEIARTALRHRECTAFLETKSAIEAAAGRDAEAFVSLHAAAEEAISAGCGASAGVSYCDRLDRLAANPEQELIALLLRANLHGHLGHSETAIETGERALLLAEQAGDERRVMQAHLVLTDACSVGSRFADAVRHAQACIGWVDAHGSGYERALAHGSLALGLDNLGRGAEALPHHQRGLAIAIELRDVQQASVASVNLGRNRLFAGRIDEADDAFARGEQFLGGYEGAASHAPMLHMARSLTLCTLGRMAEGLAAAERALQAVHRVQPGHVGLAQVRLAAVWWQLGQWARLKRSLDAVPAEALSNAAVRVGRARLLWEYAKALGAPPAERDARQRELEGVLAGLAVGERPDLRLPLVLALADARDPGAALVAIDGVRVEATRIGYGNVVLASHQRAAEVACACDPRRARREALAALALQEQGLRTTALLPAEVWLHAGCALEAAGDRAHAGEVAALGRQWLMQAVQQMDEAFRDGFLQRNPANRDLLALAVRLA